MSSGLRAAERFLGQAGTDRGPWLAVGFAAGIALWFGLDHVWEWLGLVAACLAIATAGTFVLSGDGNLPFLRLALISMPLVVSAGCLVAWSKSALVGTPPISRPMVAHFTGRVLERRDLPAEKRIRLVVAMREPGTGRPIRVRLNLDAGADKEGLEGGALARFEARLIPPSPPMLPGAYDFARVAWFSGLSATGMVMRQPEVLAPVRDGGSLASLRNGLGLHVKERLPPDSGGIAVAFVTGDRGGIAPSDDEAMRNAGLAHLLSISGLHVSAVIGGTYLVLARLLGLWPWLALRFRVPLMAALGGAVAGLAYTLLTGGEVPTVRSCIGALLVLAALSLGREPLSLRLLALAAFLVMLFWPEAVTGPSFQMSFAAVIAIVSFHGSAPMRRFLAPRDEGLLTRMSRQALSLLMTGGVIELALMPIGLYHFHRAGVFGAVANVVAIPLTTAVTMPAVALGLVLDLFDIGRPAWWVAGQSLDMLVALARWTAARPGSVTVLPSMETSTFMLLVSGGLWLALWRGRVRLLGVLPVLVGLVQLAALKPPNLLVSGDGRHVAMIGTDGKVYSLRDSGGSFAGDALTAAAGIQRELVPLDQVPGARCNRDYCALELPLEGRTWRLLISRGKDKVAERAVSAACDRSDIVISDHWLPASCRPSVLKADRTSLGKTGGMAVSLSPYRVKTVFQPHDHHGWSERPEQQFRPAASRSWLPAQ